MTAPAALGEALETKIRQAVARGWCAPLVSNRIMDIDLANAITAEVVRSLAEPGEVVKWPKRMMNLPCPDGTTDRIVGFRVEEGDPILGKFGLSEPLSWLRSVTVDRTRPASPAGVSEALSDLERATQIADKSSKIDRDRVIGRVAVKHYTTIRTALFAALQEPRKP